MSRTAAAILENETLAGDTSVIVFEEGVIGVPRARRFQLLERGDSCVRMLRSLDVPHFVLPVVDPRVSRSDYAPDFSERVRRSVDASASDELVIFAVATVSGAEGSANLRAPIVINVAKRTAAQIILDDRTLPLRAPFRDEPAQD